MSAKLQLSYPDILRLFGVHANPGSFLRGSLRIITDLRKVRSMTASATGAMTKGVDGVYVNEQLAQIDVFQARLVKGSKTQGDVSLKEFMGTVGQFNNAKSVKNVQGTTKNAELAGLLQEQEIARKVDEGYEVRGIFLTNAKSDQNAIDFLKTTPTLVLYDELELQKSYVPINKTEPIASDISFDVSGVPTMEYPMGQIDDGDCTVGGRGACNHAGNFQWRTLCVEC